MLLLSLELVLKIIGIILPLLIAIAYFTLAERKIMAAIQRRKGPNVVGFLGLLQPLADGLKLILKETTIPSNANKILFNIAPILTFFLSLLGWAVIPFGQGIVLSDLNLGLMYIFAISSLGVYGVIIAGWSSNSKYAFLGALRSAAQMISYELSMGFIIINIVILAGSFNLSDIIESQDYIWYAVPQLPMFCMFFVCALAETNRHPFDLMEAEAELVSGFNVEYAAAGFAMFFLGEYGNILLMCSLISILFLGGYKAPIFLLDFIPGPIWFGIKVVFFVILFIWVRAAYPRYRYDQLMRLGWKIFLPLSLGYLILTTGIHTSFFTSLSEHYLFSPNDITFMGKYVFVFYAYSKSYINFAFFADEIAYAGALISTIVAGKFISVDLLNSTGGYFYEKFYFNIFHKQNYWSDIYNYYNSDAMLMVIQETLNFYQQANFKETFLQFEMELLYHFVHIYNFIAYWILATGIEATNALGITLVNPVKVLFLPTPEDDFEGYMNLVNSRLINKEYLGVYFEDINSKSSIKSIFRLRDL